MPNIEYRGHVTLPDTDAQTVTEPKCYHCGTLHSIGLWDDGRCDCMHMKHRDTAPCYLCRKLNAI